jgi:hypothetical protein
VVDNITPVVLRVEFRRNLPRGSVFDGIQHAAHRSKNSIESYHQLRSAITQVGGKKELAGCTESKPKSPYTSGEPLSAYLDERVFEFLGIYSLCLYIP